MYAEDGVDGRGSAETLRAFARGANYRQLHRHLTYFEVWIRAFDRLMDAAPKLVTVPGFYSGDLTLGTYMQIETAFEQVQGRMSTIAHRWTEIPTRSVARRLRELEAELGRALPADVEGGGGDGEMVRLVHVEDDAADPGSPSAVAACARGPTLRNQRGRQTYRRLSYGSPGSAQPPCRSIASKGLSTRELRAAVALPPGEPQSVTQHACASRAWETPSHARMRAVTSPPPLRPSPPARRRVACSTAWAAP